MVMNMIFFDDFFLSNKAGIGREAKNLLSASQQIVGSRNIILLSDFTTKAQTSGSPQYPRTFERFMNAFRTLIGQSKKVYLPDGSTLIMPHVRNIRIQGENIFCIVRLHDIFPITNPEWFRFISRRNFISFFKNQSLTTKYFYLCDSKSTREALHDSVYQPKLVDVAYCPVIIPVSDPCGSCDLCRKELNKSKYIISIGTIEPRKNYKVLLELIQLIKHINELKKLNYVFVIVGKPGWKTKKLQRRLLSETRNDKNIIWYKNVCDSMMMTILSNADAFLSTSLNEGFNLPAAEAHLLNVPLILSRISVHKELYGESARYFNPQDKYSLLRALQDFSVEINPKASKSSQVKSDLNTLIEHLSDALDEKND